MVLTVMRRRALTERAPLLAALLPMVSVNFHAPSANSLLLAARCSLLAASGSPLARLCTKHMSLCGNFRASRALRRNARRKTMDEKRAR